MDERGVLCCLLAAIGRKTSNGSTAFRAEINPLKRSIVFNELTAPR